MPRRRTRAVGELDRLRALETSRRSTAERARVSAAANEVHCAADELERDRLGIEVGPGESKPVGERRAERSRIRCGPRDEHRSIRPRPEPDRTALRPAEEQVGRPPTDGRESQSLVQRPRARVLGIDPQVGQPVAVRERGATRRPRHDRA